MTRPVLRPAEPDDLPILYALHRAAFREYVVDGEPVGCLGLQDQGELLFVEYLALLPAWQDRG